MIVKIKVVGKCRDILRKQGKLPNIKPGIGVFVVYAFEQAAKQYSIVRLIPNHGQRCKEIFYLLYIHSPSSLTIYLTMRQISSAFAE